MGAAEVAPAELEDASDAEEAPAGAVAELEPDADAPKHAVLELVWMINWPERPLLPEASWRAKENC